MAKNSDHLAGFEAEDTGGLFSTFLAEEDELDRRGTMWRLVSWGVGTVAAVVIAVMASQTSLGWRRDQSATSELIQQAGRLQAAARESQNEARRLASAIETLNKDRDRLFTRVAVLEQGLDSVTGAVAKQNTQAAPLAQPEPQAAPVPAPTPAVTPVATTLPAPSEKPAAKPGPETDTASVPTAKNATAKPVVVPAPPLVDTKSMMAPPDPAAGKLIEPAKPASPASPVAAVPSPPVLAAAPPTESTEPDTAETAEPILPKIQRTDFGVDVGGANSVAGLRALWRGLLKSRANAPLAALQPIIVIREGKGGLGMQLRLVAGPLSDAAAAAKLCAVLTENNRSCETAVYDGQRLQIKADDAPSDGKPAAPARKKNAPPKRAAVEKPAAKPEPAPQPTSNWASSFFGKKNAQ